MMECLLTATLRRGDDGKPVAYQVSGHLSANVQNACWKNTAVT
jgi:hypothetical protein